MARKIDLLKDRLLLGDASEVRQLLEDGVNMPENQFQHPVLALLQGMEEGRSREASAKLEALLDHGLSVDWAIANLHKQPASKQRRSAFGLPRFRRGDGLHANYGHSNLLTRAAFLGDAEMVKMLLRRGANIQTSLFAALNTKRPQDIAPVVQALVEHLSTSPANLRDWIRGTKTVLRVAYCGKDEQMGRAWAKLMPTAQDADTRKDLISALSSRETDTHLAWWMEINPHLWNRLHDPEVIGSNEPGKAVPSLWPSALRAACKHGPGNALMRLAVAGDRAWLDAPVEAINIQNGDRSIQVLLPPLQALLHSVAPGAELHRHGKRGTRILLRNIRHLTQAGARLWVGEGARGAPCTEGCLAVGRSYSLPRGFDMWCQHHPEWLAPHPISGQTPLYFCRKVEQAQALVKMGADPGHVDNDGNQAFAWLLHRGMSYAKTMEHGYATAAEWRKWAKEGWRDNVLPLEGQAHGLTVAQMATRTATLFGELERRKSGQTHTDTPEQLLYGACHNLNAPMALRLIRDGADPFAVVGEHGHAFNAFIASAFKKDNDRSICDAFISEVSQELIERYGPMEDWPQLQEAQSNAMHPWAIIVQSQMFQYAISNWDGFIASDRYKKLFSPLEENKIRGGEWTANDGKAFVRSLFAEGRYYPSSEGGEWIDRLSLPEQAPTDILLRLVSAEECPSGGSERMSLRRAMADKMLERGADLMGQDAQGRTLGEVYQQGVDFERRMEINPEHSLATNPHILARAQAQQMNLGVARPSKTQARPGRRL